MVCEHGISERQARSAFCAPQRPRDDSPINAAIEGYVKEKRHGFDKLYPGGAADAGVR
jgi:hypothetical protein